jgi:two-component system CheB/CheR fusion protein
MVMVQEPATAKFDGMPNSAITSGHADFMLPPDLIPKGIINYTRYQSLTEAFNSSDDRVNNHGLYREILELVKDNTTFDFTSYKLPTISRRIFKKMSESNIDNLEEYLQFLKKSPDELHLLSKDFLIGVTRFFRDTEAFDVIRQEVIPAIVDAKKSGDNIKFWVPGCSTGEEAYSLAILFKECISQSNKDISIKIFATDIDKEAIKTAGKGLYQEHITKDLGIKSGKYINW